VEASGTTLTKIFVTKIFGVGPILAAKIVGIVGDVARFPSKAHFASYERRGADRGLKRGGDQAPALARGEPSPQPLSCT
jgi:transposase